MEASVYLNREWLSEIREVHPQRGVSEVARYLDDRVHNELTLEAPEGPYIPFLTPVVIPDWLVPGVRKVHIFGKIQLPGIQLPVSHRFQTLPDVLHAVSHVSRDGYADSPLTHVGVAARTLEAALSQLAGMESGELRVTEACE